MAKKMINTDVSVPGDLDLARSELGVQYPQLFDTLNNLAIEQSAGDPAKHAKVMDQLTSRLFHGALGQVEGKLHETGRYAAARGGQIARAETGLKVRDKVADYKEEAHESAMRNRLVASLIGAGSTLGAAGIDWWQGRDTTKPPLDLNAIDMNRERAGLPPAQRPYPKPEGYDPPGRTEEVAPPRHPSAGPFIDRLRPPSGVPYYEAPGEDINLTPPSLDMTFQPQPPPPPPPPPILEPPPGAPRTISVGPRRPGWEQRQAQAAAQYHGPVPYEHPEYPDRPLGPIPDATSRDWQNAQPPQRYDAATNTFVPWDREPLPPPELPKRKLPEYVKPLPPPADSGVFGGRGPRYSRGPGDMGPVGDPRNFPDVARPTEAAPHKSIPDYSGQMLEIKERINAIKDKTEWLAAARAALEDEHITDADREWLKALISKQAEFSPEDYSTEDREALDQMLDMLSQPTTPTHRLAPEDRGWLNRLIDGMDRGDAVYEELKDAPTGRPRKPPAPPVPPGFPWGTERRGPTAEIQPFSMDAGLIAGLVDIPFSASSGSSSLPEVFERGLLQAPDVMLDVYTSPDVYGLLSDRQLASIKQLLGQMG